MSYTIAIKKRASKALGNLPQDISIRKFGTELEH